MRARSAGPEQSPSQQSSWYGQTPGKVVAGNARQSQVPDLRMHQAVQKPPARHSARPDSRPDRDVEKIVKADRTAPGLLAEGRAVDIRVEANRDTPENAARSGPSRSVLPQPGLGVDVMKP